MIPFTTIPANIRTPLLYAEFDSSGAIRGGVNQVFRNLVIGQKTSAGTATANVPVKVTLDEAGTNAAALFGVGSMLHLMFKKLYLNDKYTEAWGLPLSDNGAGVAAAGTLTVTGPASAAGTINLYIGGQLVQVVVANGDAQNSIAAAINTAINAATHLPVTSTVSTNVVTVTAKNKGTLGNGIDLRLNYYEGEALPTGVAVAIVAMASGATDPTITTAISGMGETQFHAIAFPYATTALMNELETQLEDRWGGIRMIEGHLFTCKDDTASNLGTFGNGRNSKQSTILGLYKSPSPSFEWAAALMGLASYNLAIDQARPLQTLEVKGCLAPALANQFLQTERNLLLYDGISTVTHEMAGTTRVERLITTYQRSAAGTEDPSYLDLEPKFTLAFIRFDWRTYMSNKYPRHKLADDGTKFGPGQPVMTPKLGKAEAIARFRYWEEKGLVENIDQFIEELICERNVSDRTRMDWKLPPDLMNQLRIMGTQIAFIL